MSLVEAVVLVDNNSVDTGRVKAVHGLSIYIEYGRHFILFDTGPSPDILQYNSEALNIDLSLLDFVVISHLHSDHVGGLPYVGWVSPSIKTYIPYASGHYFEQLVRKNGLTPVEVLGWTSLDRDLFISKPFYGPPWEHVLVVRSVEGLVLFTGCSHPGINMVVDEVSSYFGDEVYAVIGGLHLNSAPDNIVYNTIDRLVKKVSKIAPLHCSGDKVLEYMVRKYNDKLLKAMAGSTITL